MGSKRGQNEVTISLALRAMVALAAGKPNADSDVSPSRDWIQFTATEIADTMNALAGETSDMHCDPISARSVGWMLNQLGVENRRGSNRERTRNRAVRRADLMELHRRHVGGTSDRPFDLQAQGGVTHG